MDVRKLEAFCKVYLLHSFSKAGEAMFLSQPTISSHVANLEEELGVRLFDRMGRKILPTQAGHVLYRSAAKIFDNLDEASAAIAMLRDEVVGDLSIGCSTIPSHNILPDILARFSSAFPAVGFTIHTSDSGEVIQRVADGDWPVGIVGEVPDVDGIRSELLLEDTTVVACSPEASWYKANQQLGMAELAELPWIMRGRGSATRHELEAALLRHGKTLRDLNIRCQVDGTCEAIAYAVAGVGLIVSSSLATKEFVEAGSLVQLDVPELSGKRSFYLIYHQDRFMFPALEKFVEFVRS